MCLRVGDAGRDTPGIQLLGDGDQACVVPHGQIQNLSTRQVDDHLLQAGKTLEDQPEGCKGEHIGGSGHVELLHIFQPEREGVKTKASTKVDQPGDGRDALHLGPLQVLSQQVNRQLNPAGSSNLAKKQSSMMPLTSCAFGIILGKTYGLTLPYT